MQAMFHYSIKERVSYAQEKKKVFHPVDFTVSHHLPHVFCALRPTLCIRIYLKKSLKNL